MKIRSRQLVRKIKRGFTLIELTVALAILSILIGMISMLSYNYLSLSSEMVIAQRDEMRTQAFLDWVRRTFGNLPGNAIWQITSNSDQAGRHSALISDMIVQELPFTLYWSDSPLQIKAIRLRSVPQPNGLLSLELECFDEELLDLTSSDDNSALMNVEPVATTTLLEDVRWCEWTIRDPGTDEWKEDLKRNDNRPYQLQLKLAFGENEIGLREVYWIPPKENPKLLIQEMRAGSMKGGSGGGKPDQPDKPDKPDTPTPTPPAGGGDGGAGGGAAPVAPPAATARLFFEDQISAISSFCKERGARV